MSTPSPLAMPRKRIDHTTPKPKRTGTYTTTTGDEVTGPKFKHDCEPERNCCTYLGTRLIVTFYRGEREARYADLYYAAPEQCTLARWSDEGSDYSSGVCTRTPGLREAHQIATRRGLTLRTY